MNIIRGILLIGLLQLALQETPGYIGQFRELQPQAELERKLDDGVSPDNPENLSSALQASPVPDLAEAAPALLNRPTSAAPRAQRLPMPFRRLLHTHRRGLPSIRSQVIFRRASRPVSRPINRRASVLSAHLVGLYAPAYSYDQFQQTAALQQPQSSTPALNNNEQAIADALAKAGSGPAIIVINQTPTEPNIPASQPCNNQTAGAQTGGAQTPIDYYSDQSGQSTTQMSALMPNAQIITFAQIDTLISAVGEIQKIVDDIYELMPDSDDPSVAGLKGASSQDQSFFDKASQVILFYARVRNFIKSVYNNRQRLLEDLLFLKNNVVLFKVTQRDMLRFYGLDDRYYAARIKCNPYEPKDAKFGYYWTQIAGYTDDYEKSINQVSTDVRRLEEVIMGLIAQIDALDDTHFDNAALNVLVKFDAVMMMLAGLIESKPIIEDSINNLQTDLLNLKLYRQTISETISNADQLADYYRLNGPVNIGDGSSSGVFGDLCRGRIAFALFALAAVI